MSKIFDAFQKRKADIRRTVAKYNANPADIDELTQETFLKGFAAELKQEILQPEHLLLRIAKNLSINAAVRKSNTSTKSIEGLTHPSVLEDKMYISQETRLDARQRLFVFSKALANLSPELRRALVLRRIEGLKYKEIATRVNASVSTVEKRVVAAMIDCMVYLREQGYDPADFKADLNKTERTSLSKVSIRTNVQNMKIEKE